MERIVLSLIVVLFEVVCFSFGNPLCSSHDSLALLQFKHSLNVTDGGCDNNEDCPKTASWNSTSMDCCRWGGVTCNSFTGQVIGLDLSYSRLEGAIHPNSSLFQLRHNKLSGEIRAEMFASMTNLTILDLSSSGLSWSSNINTTFPLLRSLRLGSCRVKDFPDFILNSNKLSILDLSENEIHGQFPKWFGGLGALQFLNVSHNFLTSLEHIPLETMMVLDLQSNSLRGPLPSPFCPSNTLSVINLSYNNLRLEYHEEPLDFVVYGDEVSYSGLYVESVILSVLIGYGCGLTFGFGIVYLIYLFERPRWFIDSFETITREMIYIIQRGRKRAGGIFTEEDSENL
ncbi:hypothetical protein H5410_011469 [Solanum commersonii]|uniref:Leucine-rich repeat-containing N-terminal plant-type domain-containing protein n=1 Tax=Solanum commersonii TaxID=4109 RepID=A0A9J6APR3_SOLCO|nr:hypothetical protein H5410_011469 [Solanum commersonii]